MSIDLLPKNKTTKSLTPEQQLTLLHKQLDKQQRLTITDFAFGKLRSWNDFTHSTGLTPPDSVLQKTLNAETIREVFSLIKDKVLLDKLEEPIAKAETPKPDAIVTTAEDKLPQVNGHRVIGTTKDYEDEFSVIPILRNQENGIIYRKEQELAASEILRYLIKHNYYGVGFPWPVGTGKTYVYAAVIAELYRRQWRPLMESMALYPALVITRATIVEQTERVLRDQFKLELGKQVDVTNIDQMRSRFGENFLKEKIVNRNGVESFEFQWIEPLSPAITLLDEAQAVKNIDSTQSQIFQSFNELDGENHRIVYCSGTLFTRPIESKCFAVSTRLEW